MSNVGTAPRHELKKEAPERAHTVGSPSQKKKIVDGQTGGRSGRQTQDMVVGEGVPTVGRAFLWGGRHPGGTCASFSVFLIYFSVLYFEHVILLKNKKMYSCISCVTQNPHRFQSRTGDRTARPQRGQTRVEGKASGRERPGTSTAAVVGVRGGRALLSLPLWIFPEYAGEHAFFLL